MIGTETLGHFLINLIFYSRSYYLNSSPFAIVASGAGGSMPVEWNKGASFKVSRLLLSIQPLNGDWRFACISFSFRYGSNRIGSLPSEVRRERFAFPSNIVRQCVAVASAMKWKKLQTKLVEMLIHCHEFLEISN